MSPASDGFRELMAAPVATPVPAGWCPFCGAPVRSLTTTDGRGFCAWGHGLVWPQGVKR